MRSALTRTARLVTRHACGTYNRPFSVGARRWDAHDSDGHQWSTPLAKQLAQAIQTTGPIPVASYMRQCLTSDLGGYYTASNPEGKDQFGVKGDFVTSPEISQIFGELIGIWIVAEWIAQGRKSEGVYLLEVGPGRGTLMDDILRTIRNFPDLAEAIEAVYMVEASASLRAAQHKLLCGDNPLQKSTDGQGDESHSRHTQDLKVVWREDLRLVPREANKMPFIIAHEFFDALPIHVFQSVGPAAGQQADEMIDTPTGPIRTTRAEREARQAQWREMLVSPRPPHRLKRAEPEFELTLSKAATPHSMYLPETSPRYQAVKKIDGATIEISPESQAFARDFAFRVGGQTSPQEVDSTSPSLSHSSSSSSSSSSIPTLTLSSPAAGAALIIDYGTPSTIPTNSLRGIRAHQRVSPFETAGATDVSADVDFLALAEAALQGSAHVEVHGPVDQARFLTAMGIQERAAQLVKRAVDRERGGLTGKKMEKEQLTDLVKRVESGWQRLVDMSPQGMGRLYQVMAIVPYTPAKEGEARRRPVGFGGDISL